MSQAHQPLISCITVSYNAGPTLERCLQSIVAAKALAPIEYIVIDGNSNDGSAQLLSRYRPQIDVLIAEPDGGIYDAMNKGLALATGRYICFINADDQLIPSAVPQLARQLQRLDPATGVLATAARTVAPGFEGLWIAAPLDPLAAFRCPDICHNGLYVSSAVYARVGGYDTRFRIAADSAWMLRAWSQNHRFTISRLPTVTYSIGGASSDVATHAAEIRRIAQALYPKLEDTLIDHLFHYCYTWPERRQLFVTSPQWSVRETLQRAAACYPDLAPRRRQRLQRLLQRLQHKRRVFLAKRGL